MRTNWNDTPQRFRPGKVDPLNWLPNPGEVASDAAVPFDRTRENPLEALKNTLLRAMLATISEPGFLAPVRRAANEAAAIAWLEPLPLLVFPELFAEKARAAMGQVRKQRRIRTRTALLMEVFA